MGVDWVHITFRLRSICLVRWYLYFLFMRVSETFFCFAAHLFCTFCITFRVALLQHAGSSWCSAFLYSFFKLVRRYLAILVFAPHFESAETMRCKLQTLFRYVFYSRGICFQQSDLTLIVQWGGIVYHVYGLFGISGFWLPKKITCFDTGWNTLCWSWKRLH